MPEQADQILAEARGARTHSERLLPLLELLREEDGETSPLDGLKSLLQQILEVLGHQRGALQRVESALAIGPPRRH